MGHDDAGRLHRFLGLEDQLVDHVAHDRVQTGRRLVVEHHFRADRQGPRQPDALALASGQLGGLSGLDLRGQADLVQPLRDDLARPALVADAMFAQAEGHVVEDGQAVEESGHLEEKPEPQSHLHELLAIEACDIRAVEEHLSLGRVARGR